MAKSRNGRFSLKEDRQLIQMAAASATLEEAAAIFQTSVKTIDRKAERLGFKLKRKRPKIGHKANKWALRGMRGPCIQLTPTIHPTTIQSPPAHPTLPTTT